MNLLGLKTGSSHIKLGKLMPATGIKFSNFMPVTNVSVKNYFFNAKYIREELGGLTYRVFRRFGAFVRRRARSSIRKSARISIPGRPPHSHSGLLRNNIFFAYDRADRSVVIGPTLLEGRKYLHVDHNTKTVPESLEFGGPSWNIRSQKVIQIRRRPYMWPAFMHTVRYDLKYMWAYCARHKEEIGDIQQEYRGIGNISKIKPYTGRTYIRERKSRPRRTGYGSHR